MRVDGGTPTTDASAGADSGAQCAPRPPSAWGERFGVEYSTPLGASTALDSRRALSLLRHREPARAGHQKNRWKRSSKPRALFRMSPHDQAELAWRRLTGLGASFLCTAARGGTVFWRPTEFQPEYPSDSWIRRSTSPKLTLGMAACALDADSPTPWPAGRSARPAALRARPPNAWRTRWHRSDGVRTSLS